MWTATASPLATLPGCRLTIAAAEPLTFDDVLTGWEADASFRLWFGEQLLEQGGTACKLELPRLTTENLADAFECVVLPHPSLERRPDPDAFAEHYPRADSGIVAVPNLRGDAVLIIPTPSDTAENGYAHLSRFLSDAPEPQQHAFWTTTARETRALLQRRPVWLNTAGMGVAWLHLRLDSVPKYYRHRGYTAET